MQYGLAQAKACLSELTHLAARLGITHFLSFDNAHAAVAARVLVGVQIWAEAYLCQV
jgi:hypothetical protein